MKKKAWIIAIIILVVIFGGLLTFDFSRMMKMKKLFANYTPPAKVVSAIVIKPQDWQPLVPEVGQIEAYQGVEISAEVPGRVNEIYFTSGQQVKSGDKLIQLDDSSEKAQLKSIAAQLQNAETNLERQKHLL